MDRPASTASLSVGNQAGRQCMVVSPQFFSFFDRDGYGSAFLGSRSRFSQFGSGWISAISTSAVGSAECAKISTYIWIRLYV